MEDKRAPSPTLVAVAGWMLPGLGYFLLGQRARAITIGISITLLYFMGILIGGVRVVDVPGYDDQGHKILVQRRDSLNKVLQLPNGQPMMVWVMKSSPMVEIRDKPWAIAQVLTGPIGVFTGWWSVSAARPVIEGGLGAQTSHAHVHDIGTLYTAVAGMLNLLSIIDASSRATEASR